ncbi:MAG: type II toxin-antitoxin system RelE/ParE family toxin [Sulfuricella sp.]
MNEIAHYLTPEGRDIYQEWLDSLADRHAKARVMTRVERLRQGNFGECRPLANGVWEIKIDWGPGYRIYYAQAGQRLVLLLIGGDKRKQAMDIKTAVTYWRDWQRRQT